MTEAKYIQRILMSIHLKGGGSIGLELDAEDQVRDATAKTLAAMKENHKFFGSKYLVNYVYGKHDAAVWSDMIVGFHVSRHSQAYFMFSYDGLPEDGDYDGGGDDEEPWREDPDFWKKQ